MNGALAFTVGPGGDVSWLAVGIAVAALILLIALVALLSGRKARQRQAQKSRSSERALTPRELLDRRFAAGEIDQEEYERQAIVLGGSGQASER